MQSDRASMQSNFDCPNATKNRLLEPDVCEREAFEAERGNSLTCR